MKKRLFSGLACMVLALGIFFLLNRPTAGEEVLHFPSSYKDKAVQLEASLWRVADADYGVVICPGYSCDRQKWRPFADLYVANGLTTMVFDYAGQGASSGTIGFDNAKTDAIPTEIGDAVELFHQETGIEFDHIILAGHSMGGRAILRFLYDCNRPDADTKVEKREIGNVILLSPEVNYSFNAQASLFAGTSDDVEEPWASFYAADIKGTNVYLFGSTADDIVSDENILAIADHIGLSGLGEEGCVSAVGANIYGDRITVGIVPGVLHSYQMYSPKFASLVNDALTEITGKEAVYQPSLFSRIYLGWFLALVGIGLLLSGLTGRKQEVNEALPKLLDAKKFLLFKLLMWVPGLVFAFLICCICVVMPFGSPVMNTPYMCCIAGYGLVMLLCYRKGKFAGTSGKLPQFFGKKKYSCAGEQEVTGKEIGIGILVSVLLCFAVWYVLRASMYRLLPWNARLFWVTFAGVLMMIGYYVSGCESDMLREAEASVGVVIAYNLIQYVALFLLVLFYLVIGSYSGLIGQVQNMVLMYVFCVPLGNYVRRFTGSRLCGAFVTGFLFQTLMITTSALISLF